MSVDFYRAFEERYRGTRELIRARLQIYVPFVQPLLANGNRPLLLDLGCGRGEWLELGRDLGFEVMGVDLDSHMLAACRELGLPVAEEDALAVLRRYEDGSIAVVSAFHLVEHLPFDTLAELIREAHRVLEPGGLLIMETPNPENFSIATNNFWLDPTHQRPVPPLLLAFLPEYAGFALSRVVRLQEDPEILARDHATLADVLTGVSPDYAVIARQAGGTVSIDALDHEYGLDPSTLMQRHQAMFDARYQQLSKQSDWLEQRLDQLEIMLLQGEAERAEVEAALHATLASRSWRVTRPLRVCSLQMGRLVARIGPRMREVRLFVLERTRHHLKVLLAHPAARRRLLRIARAVGLEHRVRAVISRVGSVNGGAVPSAPPDDATPIRLHPAAMPALPVAPDGLRLPAISGQGADLVRIVGHLEGEYSLAIVNRGLAVAMSAAVDGRLQFIPWHGERYQAVAELPAAQREALQAAVGYAPDGASDRILSITHHWPIMADPLPADQRVMLFFWEETAVPPDIVRFMIEHFTAVMVASRFVKRSLRNSGYPGPIVVIPLGVDHLVGPDTPLKSFGALAPERQLRLLHVSSLFDRKGADVLLDAYFAAFSAADDIELYIKTFPNPHNGIHELLAAKRAGRTDAPRVMIDEAALGDAEMLELYRSADALVLPTRGEGFNLPAAEAMALGVPVVTTGHGGQADFCTAASAMLIPFRFAFSQSHLRTDGACWVEPDRRLLASQLRFLERELRTGGEALHRRCMAAREHVQKTYRWSETAQAVLGSSVWLRQQHCATSQPLRVALLSPWRSPCGIAEYSAKLLGGLADEAAIELTVYADDRTAAAENGRDGTVVCWQAGQTQSVVRVLQMLSTSDADVILVQHQPTLFQLSDAVCEELASLRHGGRCVVLELHSTLPLLQDLAISERALTALRRLDRIVVHQLADLNHLLGLGLVDNTLLLPLGVVSPVADSDADGVRAELGIGKDALVLGSFGFLLEHKGIDAILDAVELLGRDGARAVHFVGIHAMLDERSQELFQRLQERARTLNLSDRLHWITDFRAVPDCLRLLSAADYVLFPYRETRESASAAVTIGLASMRPVLTSPLAIFADVEDAAYRMAGGNATDIAAAVQALEDDVRARDHLLARQREWLAQRDFSKISARLLGTLRGLCHDRALQVTVGDESVTTPIVQASAQLLVDVSELYVRDARTGIQRVVRSILAALLASPPTGFVVRPVFGVPGEGYRYADRLLPAIDGSASSEQPVTVSSGDHFLGLDLSAHLFPEAEAWLAVFRAADVRVHFVVYDIIPLLHPEFTVPGLRNAFDHWLRGLGKEADTLLCISNTVARDVEQWLRQHVATLPLPMVRSFRLGADLENSSPTRGLPPDASEALEQLREPTVFLMVGTIEPRKGHAQALAAFEVLWRQGVDVCLAVVGKQGWMVDELVRRLRDHPEQGRRLFWFEGISDEYLEQLYQVSDCLLAASLAEGFGLPLIEAAQRGLPILARDIPVFREVAGDAATYFKGDAPAVLAVAIKQWAASHSLGKTRGPGGMAWLTWRDSTDELISAMLGPNGVLDKYGYRTTRTELSGE